MDLPCEASEICEGMVNTISSAQKATVNVIFREMDCCFWTFHEDQGNGVLTISVVTNPHSLGDASHKLLTH